ncbi:PREDICTED: protein pygopus [Cyphomyrmex costatus]|uniref:Protein pygopus n=1 Tax=Cyphomyrmex costatus TaxID=456900 RepID=A0A195CBL5_9HYME|nr:PREDICTED: protein pygopus [Cyphomyrmex costatus]KYM97503.1 Protein pygopus [Cyphomyrmex costatus]
MSHNIAGMPPFTRMPLGGMGMGVNMGPNAPHPDSSAHPHPPPPPPAGANPKKKRRTNASVAQPPPQQPPSVQDLLPPPLTGYGDTIVASNPFDDTPPQTPQSPMMHGAPSHMHPHHPHHMGGPPMRGMSPLTTIGGMSPMMPHNMGNMSPMGNSPMTNHMNHMGAMSPMNHAPIGGMSPMNNMGPNMPPGPMNTMNNHMNISHMGNSQLSGPPMGSPMNNMNSGPMGSPMNNMGHNMGSPMGGPLGSPMNMGGSNHMPNGPMNMNNINSHIPPNSPLNGPSLNNVNSPLGHNGSQPHPNHMGNNLNNLGRPMNGPMTTMSSMVSNNMNMTGPNQINNMNMGGPGISSMSNMNISHHNQMGSHMAGPMGTLSNNMGGGPPMGHPINSMGGSMPPHGFQGPPGMGPKPMPISAGKIYPPDQSMVFNPQNPNAPPIYPCGICHKEVHDNDQAILCESGCNFWFHRGCTGLTEYAYQSLTQEVYAEWVCDKCLQSKSIPLVKYKP